MMQIDRNRAKQFLKGSSCLHVHFRIELNDYVIMDFLEDTVPVVRLSRHLIKSLSTLAILAQAPRRFFTPTTASDLHRP